MKLKREEWLERILKRQLDKRSGHLKKTWSMRTPGRWGQWEALPGRKNSEQGTEVSCPCHERFRAGSPKLSLVAWWEPLVHKASTLSGTPHSHSLGPDMSGLEKTSCILQIDLSSTLTYGLLTSPLALYLDTGFILDCNFSFTWLITSDYSSHQR